jgi:GR25 family glycosyltransferase involved in LPS biosynthesis
MKYYLITYDKERFFFMKNQFQIYGIDFDKVKVMDYPNREDLTEHIIKECYDSKRFNTLNNHLYVSSYSNEWHNPMPKGLISCSYKHYLCVKDIIESNLNYGIIMEDNILIQQNVPETINKYLSEVGDDWDIIFDGDICNLHANNYTEGKLLYEVQRTRGLNFYLVSNRGAKKLIDSLIPFSLNLDNFINLLIEEKIVDLKIFWAESGLIHKINRPSTWR